MKAKTKTYQFQAESRQLLDLMIHSLYTNKEIFLRELISNASDAMDRLRFEALTHPEYISSDRPLEVVLEADPKARTLTIRDSGIGMNRDEVIQNIGTIARSGTREMIEKMKASTAPGDLVESLIGRFGVGFYSAFMVADKVQLLTRRAGEEKATLWESTGDGEYRITESDRPEHGTTITLNLKSIDPDTGIEDYTVRWTLSRIVTRYSDFVAYPIRFIDITAEKKAEDTEDDTKPLNSMKPIWTRPRSEVKDEEYAEFYKHISHDWNEPLKTLSFKAEGINEYQALVFVPSQAPFDLFYPTFKWGLHLYVRRVMIIEHCEDLLPRYLRFVRGVVDSADLPLNISRQRLQEDRHITQIRKWMTRRILESLDEMMKKEPETYVTFWKECGRVLKEGVSFDYENKDRILPLVLLPSSNDPEKLTTLREYIDRMKPDQQEIYYLTGETRSAVENSPHLEAFRERGIEVLYLIEPVDELMVDALHEFEGKKVKSVGKGTVQLGTEDERTKADQELKDAEAGFKQLMDALQNKLEAHVKQVRLTNRLTTSPACLVGNETDYSPSLERLLGRNQMGGAKQRRILELNPGHEILAKLKSRFDANADDPALNDYAELLLGTALLAEGSPLHDSQRFTNAMAELMKKGL